MQSDELTILTSWAEAVAEVLSDAPERAQAVLADPLPGAPWRAALGIEEPSQPLSSAIDSMQTCPVGDRYNGSTDVGCSPRRRKCQRAWRNELDAWAHRVLQSALEQRQMRLNRTRGS